MSAPVRAFPSAKIALFVCLAGECALLGGSLRGSVSVGWAVLLLVAILGIVALGIFFAQLGLFARPIVGADEAQSGDRLALTFDDGPDEQATRQILDLLDEAGQRATFFVIGHKAGAAPTLLREIASRGHGLANHSFAHQHTTPFLAPHVLAEELARAEAVLIAARTDGAAAGRWFRAPVGIISPRVAQAARIAGLTLVSWTASARDGTAHATVDSALGRLRGSLRAGAILVLHDGAERGDRTPIAPRVLEKLLGEMKARGLRSVTLDELLA